MRCPKVQLLALRLVLATLEHYGCRARALRHGWARAPGGLPLTGVWAAVRRLVAHWVMGPAYEVRHVTSNLSGPTHKHTRPTRQRLPARPFALHSCRFARRTAAQHAAIKSVATPGLARASSRTRLSEQACTHANPPHSPPSLLVCPLTGLANSMPSCVRCRAPAQYA